MVSHLDPVYCLASLINETGNFTLAIEHTSSRQSFWLCRKRKPSLPVGSFFFPLKLTHYYAVSAHAALLAKPLLSKSGKSKLGGSCSLVGQKAAAAAPWVEPAWAQQQDPHTVCGMVLRARWPVQLPWPQQHRRQKQGTAELTGMAQHTVHYLLPVSDWGGPENKDVPPWHTDSQDRLPQDLLSLNCAG